MFSLEAFQQPVWLRLSHALVHFCWQGFAVAAMLLAVLWLFRIRRAEVRYGLGLLALLAMAACPALTYAVLGVASSNAIVIQESVAASCAVPQSRDGSPPLVAPAVRAPRPLLGISAEGDSVPAVATKPWRAWPTDYLKLVQPYAVVVWITGVLLFSGRLLLSLAGVCWIARAWRPVSDELGQTATALGRRLRLRSTPILGASYRVREAIVTGFVRPMVMLPVSWLTDMTPDVLEAVIAHELAHIRRWDVWANLLQRLVETLLFYHPAVWWLSRRVSLDREMCCDELAAAASQGRVVYAQALEAVARLRVGRTAVLVHPAVGGNRMVLLNRVRHVLGLSPLVQHSRWWPAGLLALSVPLGIWLASASLAQTEPKRGQPKAAPAPAVAAPASAAAAPKLREEAGQPAPAALVEKLASANQPWLRPRTEGLSYNFSMVHPAKGDRWELSVQFTGPDSVILRQNGRTRYEGRVDNEYDPDNSAYPPRQLTLQQGVTFFGPLQEFALAPQDVSVRAIGDAKLDGVDAQVLHVKPVGKPSEKAIQRHEQRLRRDATRPEHLYEFTPVEREVGGAKKAVIEIKSVYQEGPGWREIVAAHAKNPAEIRWGGRVITAAVRDYRGQVRPVIVLNRDPQFQGKSPITATIFHGGIGNVTPQLRLGEGQRIFDEALHKKLKAESPVPSRVLPMRIGCGISGCWYGYSGGGAEVDQVWIDRATGFVLREEGFARGQCRFVVQYGDFQKLPGGGGAPRHVTVTLQPGDPEDSWVFDMRFALVDGKVWLLEELTESQGAKKAIATAKISEAKLTADKRQ